MKFRIFAPVNTLIGKKAVYYTLGCKLNFAETSTIQKQLEAAGVGTAQNGEAADICIVNTCSVTEVADSKSRQAISKLHRKHPEALIIVTGCYAQLHPEKLAALEGVDIVVGKEEVLNNVISLFHDNVITETETSKVQPFVPACARGERTRFFLKVQDGCNYFCTYCTIPFARGRSRNGSIASLVRQAEEAARGGGKEIVLTGVNIGDFGKTTGEQFIDLLRALDEVEGIQRYRISSIEPNLLTEEVIRFCSQSRAFMPHFHIPLQSGSDEVLKLMHRRYDTAFFAHKIEEVRTYIPDAFIGVDVIAGMRGETDEMFAEALRFMRSLPVSQYHVFSYSERPGTKALSIPGKVTPQKKHERSQQILSLSDEKLHTYYNIYKGQMRPVLLEKPTPNPSLKGSGMSIMHGFTDNYIRVETRSNLEGLDNAIVQVRLGEWNEKGDALIGEIVNSK
ncbi:MAG: tRNA (N(6)-L-threonylcarbamoyladenosine(37)-C(2))-methylthiotransferase MtaB [Bacteroidaceae bacterium]|nr:tRNA (N(6)-L-threonylcarbamoyladenosine(37)-C(2))-methylthiotransferase MtaB [Bacteroidaceae bacterium]